MAKFKKGDRVMVRKDANTQFRGRMGVIEKLPNEYANLAGYTVRIESKEFKAICHFIEQDLEIVNDK